jgi:hypothetical protein
MLVSRGRSTGSQTDTCFAWQVPATEMAIAFAHLADLGYAIVSREDNIYCNCCSEFTFLRVQQPC